MTLPIDDIRAEFERLLASSSRIVVTAETGAGKSTRVPVWLAERVQGLVLVVEPRRVACNALADYLSAQCGEATGQTFGSRVRFSDRSSARTRVLFCTPGVALRMLADTAQLGALVVDEFHERSWQVDLVVAAAANLPRLRSVPLILTSATIDANAAAAPLGASMLHATGRTFPVALQYDPAVPEPSAAELGPRAGAAIDRALEEHQGDVLVFLPGMKEIRAVERALGRRAEEILVVHGSQPPEAMRRVFAASDRRRVYLATNVAETSITLPGVRVVIDSGLARSRIHRAGRTVLATVPISDASMQQRAGRAGRVAAGVCIRLWSQRYKPAPFQRPEIERVELDDMLLQAAELGLVGDALSTAVWVTPPPEFAVQRARSRLASLAAVDGRGLTERGRQLAQLPVSAEEAALLVGAPPDIDATLCDLVALLQARGSFLRDTAELPPRARDAVRDARIELLEGVADEVATSLILLRSGDPKTHHLSERRLKEARAIGRQLRDLIGASGESLDGLAEYILSRWPAAGFVRRPRADRARGRSEPWANGATEVQVFAFEPVDPEVEPRKAHAAVILETDWLASERGVMGIGRMVLPTELQALAAAGLGESTITGTTLDKRSRSKLVIAAVREVQLAGVTLERTEGQLRGADLHRAVAGFVLENRLMRGAGDAVRDALHGWGVLAQWKGEPLSEYSVDADSVPTDVQEWLATRLATLGVETAADLALLDNADLVPDLERETGIPNWVSEPLLKAFPRLWNYQGGLYSCTLQPGARSVQLEPVDAKARKIKEPAPGALPRFHGLRVVYQQGSRRLTLR